LKRSKNKVFYLLHPRFDAGGYHHPETGNMILVGSEDPACDEKEWIENPDITETLRSHNTKRRPFVLPGAFPV